MSQHPPAASPPKKIPMKLAIDPSKALLSTLNSSTASSSFLPVVKTEMSSSSSPPTTMQLHSDSTVKGSVTSKKAETDGTMKDCTSTARKKSLENDEFRESDTSSSYTSSSSSEFSSSEEESSTTSSSLSESERTLFDFAVSQDLIKNETVFEDDEDQAAVSAPPRPPIFKALPSNFEAAIRRQNDKLNKENNLIQIKDDNKAVSLGTSKVNYIDPRIICSWANAEKVPIKSIFSATLQKKFSWALDAKDFKF